MFEVLKKSVFLLCSDQQIEAISTRLPVDKSDLKTFFPKYINQSYKISLFR